MHKRMKSSVNGYLMNSSVRIWRIRNLYSYVKMQRKLGGEWALECEPIVSSMSELYRFTCICSVHTTHFAFQAVYITGLGMYGFYWLYRAATPRLT